MSSQTIDDTPIDTGEGDGSISWSDYMIDRLEAVSRHVALLAAWIAMCGSLFFSEVLGWPPCVLCWYQRILMYPLTLTLAIGIWRRDRGLHLYVLPFSIIGAGVSLYHYLLTKTDWLPPPACTTGIPCTVDYLNWFGFINIPFLALIAFLIITFMMLASALFQLPEEEIVDGGTAAGVSESPASSGGFDGARLAVVMIVVGVVLSFMLGSTMV